MSKPRYHTENRKEWAVVKSQDSIFSERQTASSEFHSPTEPPGGVSKTLHSAPREAENKLYSLLNILSAATI